MTAKDVARHLVDGPSPFAVTVYCIGYLVYWNVVLRKTGQLASEGAVPLKEWQSLLRQTTEEVC